MQVIVFYQECFVLTQFPDCLNGGSYTTGPDTRSYHYAKNRTDTVYLLANVIIGVLLYVCRHFTGINFNKPREYRNILVKVVDRSIFLSY